MQINVLSSGGSRGRRKQWIQRDKLFVFPIVLIRRSQHCNRYKIGLQLSGRTHGQRDPAHSGG